MNTRRGALEAAQRASEIFKSSGGRERFEQDGYSRVDPFAIAAWEGVPVMLRPLDKLLGLFVRAERPGIMVNVERSAGLVHLTCAHELGHYFLGHETTTDETLDFAHDAEQKEHDAEWFAYALMMPRTLLAHVMKRKRWARSSLHSPHTLYQLSLRLGLSYTATIWSLQRQNLISYGDAHKLAHISPKSIKQALVGNGQQLGNTDVWLLDQNDRDFVLEPRPTDRFIVDLPGSASAGYLWTLENVVEEGFLLKPLSVESADPRFGSADNVGTNAALRYRLERPAVEPSVNFPDRVDFSFVESRPWVAPAPDDERFGLAAAFEVLETGLTRAEKANFMEDVASA